MKTFKNISLSVLLLASMSIFAQEQQNIDIIKTTKLEKAKFKIDGVLVDKKIRINETRTQVIDTKPSQRNLLNQERLNTPIKVTKTIIIDDDNDSGFDRAAIISYDIKNNEIYNLEINIRNSSDKIKTDDIILNGEKKEAYLLGNEDLAIFGYINEKENTFELEYF
tara:strand:+ start:86718 stop:87215 length:498 start_codon:yes stop_codon:yes gene_type:complete